MLAWTHTHGMEIHLAVIIQVNETVLVRWAGFDLRHLVYDALGGTLPI